MKGHISHNIHSIAILSRGTQQAKAVITCVYTLRIYQTSNTIIRSFLAQIIPSRKLSQAHLPHHLVLTIILFDRFYYLESDVALFLHPFVKF